MVARSMPLGRSDPRNGENHGKKNPKISEENPMILYVEDDFHVFVFFLWYKLWALKIFFLWRARRDFK